MARDYPTTSAASLYEAGDDTIVYPTHIDNLTSQTLVWESRAIFHRAVNDPEPDEFGCDCGSGWQQFSVCGQMTLGCDHGGGLQFSRIRLGDLDLGRHRPCLKCWPGLRLP